MAKTGRLAYLDGIRAVAIGAVLSLHWLSWYVPAFHGGSVGVDVFFVLSGFLITTLLWRSAPMPSLAAAWRSFVRRRVVRLYPALLGLVAVSALLYAAVPSAPLSAGEVLRRGGLALAQTSSFWAASRDGGLWVTELHPFGQTWSLAVEWYFYLLWPLLVLGARRRGWSARRLAATSLGGAAVLYAVSLPMAPLWFYFGPTARSGELLVGAALALWFQARGLPTTPLRFATPLSTTALASVAGYTVLGSDGDTALYRFVGIPVAVLATVLLIRAGYANHGDLVHRLLSHPWAAAVGRHSYSLYLWHLVPMLLLEDVTGVPKPVLGVVAAAATVVLTAASYRWLEQPFLKPRGDVLQPRTGPPVVKERAKRAASPVVEERAKRASRNPRTLSPQPQHTPLGQRGEEVLG
jgi:peptidoglycan/LPS O-acetylase OafA/YrhL